MSARTFCIFAKASLLVGALSVSSCARRLPVRGMVLRVDAQQQTVLISHRDIPNYMRAMTMPFRVRTPAELKNLKPGAEIEFQLVVRKTGSYIRHVRRLDRARGGAVVDDGDDRFVLPQSPGKIEIGAIVPDFVLTDQQGRALRLSDFRGKVAAVNFIYTRCPLPDVCPRLSATFASLQRRFAARIGKDLVLLSITIDPDYDTPKILQEYAGIWKANPEGWHFLTGPHADIEKIAASFGMTYWAEEGVIAHTSQTGIVGRDGRLAAMVNGSSFTGNQLGDLIARELE